MQETVFCLADLELDHIGIEALLVELQGLQDLADDIDLLRLIEDREVSWVSQGFRMLAEDPDAETVERGDRDPARGRCAGGLDDEFADAFFEFLGGLPCERESEDRGSWNVSIRDQVRDPIGHRARLAAACARQHEERAVTVKDRLALMRVEFLEVEAALNRHGGAEVSI